MWPLIEIAIEPRSPADRGKLGAALSTLAASDPALSVTTDPESGQTVLGGDSEQQLERVLEAILRVHGVDATIGAPNVAYREIITRRADIDYTHKKQFGGGGQFARVKIVFEPGEPGSGAWFEDQIVDGALPTSYIAGVAAGLASVKENGLLAGFPLIDFKATLVDGAYHDIDSSAYAFEIASRGAFKELREKGGPKLLEPIMRLGVQVRDEHLGAVIADLNARRAKIAAADEQSLTAIVPLAGMLGYGRDLPQIAGPDARFEMTFLAYEPVQLPPVSGPDLSDRLS